MSACVLFHDPKGWDGELTNPVDWHVATYRHLTLGDRVFLSRTEPRGIFAAGTVVAPPPSRRIVHAPAVFEAPNTKGKMTPHINVQVDIPSPVVPANPPRCSYDYPVLLPHIEFAGRPRNGSEIPSEVSVEHLCEKLRKAWEKCKD